jgi:hypothetical protein
MLRVSTTLLDSFRLFLDPSVEWMTEEKLIADLMKTGPVTPAMRLGSAFGAVLESPWVYESGAGYKVDGHYFDRENLEPALSLFDRRGIFECKATRDYGDVRVVAKVDYILGAAIHETKTTLDAFDFEKYAASCQWRFYLDAFTGAKVCTYHVFELAEDGPACLPFAEQVDRAAYEAEHAAKGLRVEDPPACYRIKPDGIRTFNLFPYPGMHDDCARLVAQFRDWAVGAGLDRVLEARHRAAEAA